MAIASVKIECSKCGETFEFRKKCYNRRDADSCEDWARNNVFFCPECERKRRAEIRHAADERFFREFCKTRKLPEITGASEKQVAYAERLRIEAISRDFEESKMCYEMYSNIDHKELIAVARENNMTPNECLSQEFDKLGCLYLYRIFTVSDAGKLIDALKKH